MRSIKFLSPVLVLAIALAPAAHAQFGSGIVYDPTQSAHAIQQLSQGEQELQHWATELQDWEQHLQKEEQIYTTAYQTMNQVIAAYNLAYQMSRMPQNLACPLPIRFLQVDQRLESQSRLLQYIRHHVSVAQCPRPRQPHPRRISLQRRCDPSTELSVEQFVRDGFDDPDGGPESVRQL